MTLAVGDAAPDFSTRNQHGETIGRNDLTGAPTVLVFFPWAFSGICTGELAALRGSVDRFRQAGARVLAVSCDAMFTQRAFADAEGFDFDLLSDHWPHGSIASAFGVFDDQAGCSLRGTFLLDADSRIRWSVVNGIGEARDLEDVFTALAA